MGTIPSGRSGEACHVITHCAISGTLCMKVILDHIARHRAGEPCGMFAVCSAHPLVIETTLRHARRSGVPFALIEATSNQVNQDGGYTGMTPALFRDFVHDVA